MDCDLPSPDNLDEHPWPIKYQLNALEFDFALHSTNMSYLTSLTGQTEKDCLSEYLSVYGRHQTSQLAVPPGLDFTQACTTSVRPLSWNGFCIRWSCRIRKTPR